MSLKNKLIFSFIIITFSFGLFIFTKPKTTETIPFVPTSVFTGQGVVDRLFQIQIKNDIATQSENEPVEIKAQISTPFDFEGPVHYKFILTEKIQLIEGSLEDTFQDIKVGQPKIVKIKVLGFTKNENRQIAFQVSAEKNNRHYYSDGIIASKKEETFEDIVQNVERIKKEQKENSK